MITSLINDDELLMLRWDGTEGDLMRDAVTAMVAALKQAGADGSVVIGHSMIVGKDGDTTSTFGLGIPSLAFLSTSHQSLHDCFNAALRRLAKEQTNCEIRHAH